MTGLDGTLRITQIPCDICALDVAAHGGLPVSRKRRNAKYDRPNSNQCVLLSGYSIRLIDAVQNHQKKYALVSLDASPAHCKAARPSSSSSFRLTITGPSHVPAACPLLRAIWNATNVRNQRPDRPHLSPASRESLPPRPNLRREVVFWPKSPARSDSFFAETCL